MVFSCFFLWFFPSLKIQIPSKKVGAGVFFKGELPSQKVVGSLSFLWFFHCSSGKHCFLLLNKDAKCGCMKSLQAGDQWHFSALLKKPNHDKQIYANRPFNEVIEAWICLRTLEKVTKKN